jgi:hypothetical protein
MKCPWRFRLPLAQAGLGGLVFIALGLGLIPSNLFAQPENRLLVSGKIGLAWYFLQIDSGGGTKSMIKPGLALGGTCALKIRSRFFLEFSAMNSSHHGQVERLVHSVVYNYDTIIIAPYPLDKSPDGIMIESLGLGQGQYEIATSKRSVPVSLIATNLTANLLYRFSDLAIKPYIVPLGLGASLEKITLTDPEPEITSQTRLDLNFGGGVEYHFLPHIFVSGEVRYHLFFFQPWELTGIFTSISLGGAF